MSPVAIKSRLLRLMVPPGVYSVSRDFQGFPLRQSNFQSSAFNCAPGVNLELRGAPLREYSYQIIGGVGSHANGKHTLSTANHEVFTALGPIWGLLLRRRVCFSGFGVWLQVFICCLVLGFMPLGFRSKFWS